MTTFGLTLSSEEHAPRRLVDIAALAEEHDFDFVSISDHYHPWVDAQGQSPFVWSMIGAVAERTSNLDVAVGVTCRSCVPPGRAGPSDGHPGHSSMAVHMGRGHWCALNEHITGERWPIAPHRSRCSKSDRHHPPALEGEEVTIRGQYFHRRERPRVRRPPSPIPIVVSAFASAAAKMAARVGDACGRRRRRHDRDVRARRGAAGPCTARSRCAGRRPRRSSRTSPSDLPNTASPASSPGPAYPGPLRAGLVERDEGDDRRVRALRTGYERDHRSDP